MIGARILEGIRENRANIFTHPDHKEELREIFDEILGRLSRLSRRTRATTSASRSRRSAAHNSPRPGARRRRFDGGRSDCARLGQRGMTRPAHRRRARARRRAALPRPADAGRGSQLTEDSARCCIARPRSRSSPADSTRRQGRRSRLSRRRASAGANTSSAPAGAADGRSQARPRQVASWCQAEARAGCRNRPMSLEGRCPPAFPRSSASGL